MNVGVLGCTLGVCTLGLGAPFEEACWGIEGHTKAMLGVVLG